MNKKRKSIVRWISLAITLVFSSSLCIAASWQTLSSFKEIRRLRVINDTLYAATSGGLLAIDNFNTPGRSFLNTDGLGTINLTDIIEDSNGQMWLTGFGRLVRFDKSDPQPFLFVPAEGDPFPLNTVVDDDDNLWIGTDSGLVLFSKVNDGGQIEGHFQLTTINPFPEVNEILLVSDSIWLATSSGLLVADRSNTELTPADWRLFQRDNFPELRSDTVRNVVSFLGDIYVATSGGVFRLVLSPGDTVFSPVPGADNRRINDLMVEGDSLFYYYVSGLGVITVEGATLLPGSGLPSAPATGIGWNGVRWVAVSGGGLYAGVLGVYEEYVFTGAPNNDVTSVTVDGEGLPVAGFGRGIFARYDGAQWSVTDIGDMGATTGLVTDRFGRVWAGTWGRGLWLETEDTAFKFDETNSTCIGIGGDPSFVVIRDIATSDEQVFAACFLAANNYPVAVGRLDSPEDRLSWDSIGVDQGLTIFLVTSLGYGSGQLAVGTEASGVFLCDVAAALSGADNACRQYTESNSPLISDVIRVLEYSPWGDVWVGTNFGLSRWDPGIERFADVLLPAGIGPDISALEFDGRGNLWIGSKTGLARLDGTSGDYTIYKAATSGLVSDKITGLALNQSTGELYVATESGLSVLTPELQQRTAALDSVLAVPNPFVIRSPDDRLEFNFSREGTARIFTVAGEPVTELSTNASWDGRNDSGKEVASGVYLFIVTDGDGNLARGKFLLVRE